MSKVLSGSLLVLLSLTWTHRAWTWEFTLEGSWLWIYEYFAQQGDEGFFGEFDSASPTLSSDNLPHFPAYNAWVGDRSINGVQCGMVTASDAAFQFSRRVVRRTDGVGASTREG